MTMGRHVHSYTLYRYGVKSGCAAGRRRCGRACRVGQATVGDAGGTGAGGGDDLLRPAPLLPGRGHAGPITSRRRPMRPRAHRARRGPSRGAGAGGHRCAERSYPQRSTRGVIRLSHDMFRAVMTLELGADRNYNHHSAAWIWRTRSSYSCGGSATRWAPGSIGRPGAASP